MRKCKYLAVSDEAHSSADGAEWTPAAAYNCTWACGRHAVAPAWFDKLNGGGQMVTPEVECIACPTFEWEALI